MKNKFLLLGFVGILTFSCNKKVETTTTTTVTEVNKDSIKTVIQGMETAYAKAMEQKNVDAIMPYYADDIVSIDGGHAPVSGKENVKAEITKQFAQMPNKFTIEMNTTDVVVSDSGDMVAETGTYAMNDSTGVKAASGHFMTSFRKKDGKYECFREMVASDKKDEPMPAAEDKKK